ncbi:hypothetical protein [Floridanema evergladense]|uniref:Uncharacterized protein n=1 Tax=Floridaenema evergladense BLCC-F167 TaxID=3153639 RepID=A0ABV4WER8_9CYAN
MAQTKSKSSSLAGVKSANSLSNLATSPGGQVSRSTGGNLAQSSGSSLFQKSPVQPVSHDLINVSELDPSTIDPRALIEDGSKKQTDADRAIDKVKIDQTVNWLKTKQGEERVKQEQIKLNREKVKTGIETAKLVRTIAKFTDEANKTNLQIETTNINAGIYDDLLQIRKNVADNLHKQREVSDQKTQMNLGGWSNVSKRDLSFTDED